MITNNYLKDVLNGVHQPSDTYKVALYGASAVIDATTPAYTSTGEITSTGYTAGGAVLANFRVADDGVGAAVLDFDDVIFNNCNIVCRKILIYNASKSNKALTFHDYGEDIGILGTGTFVVQIPSGIIRVATA